MTDNPYIYFEDETPYGRKTKILLVRTRSADVVLGEIKWYGPWRQYCFFPSRETIFNKGCMETIIAQVDELMAERKVSK